MMLDAVVIIVTVGYIRRLIPLSLSLLTNDVSIPNMELRRDDAGLH